MTETTAAGHTQTSDDSVHLDRGSSHSSVTLTESGLKYFISFAIAVLFLVTILSGGVAYSLARAQAASDKAEEAQMYYDLVYIHQIKVEARLDALGVSTKGLQKLPKPHGDNE